MYIIGEDKLSDAEAKAFAEELGGDLSVIAAANNWEFAQDEDTDPPKEGKLNGSTETIPPTEPEKKKKKKKQKDGESTLEVTSSELPVSGGMLEEVAITDSDPKLDMSELSNTLSNISEDTEVYGAYNNIYKFERNPYDGLLYPKIAPSVAKERRREYDEEQGNKKWWQKGLLAKNLQQRDVYVKPDLGEIERSLGPEAFNEYSRMVRMAGSTGLTQEQVKEFGFTDSLKKIPGAEQAINAAVRQRKSEATDLFFGDKSKEERNAYLLFIPNSSEYNEKIVQAASWSNKMFGKGSDLANKNITQSAKGIVKDLQKTFDESANAVQQENDSILKEQSKLEDEGKKLQTIIDNYEADLSEMESNLPDKPVYTRIRPFQPIGEQDPEMERALAERYMDGAGNYNAAITKMSAKRDVAVQEIEVIQAKLVDGLKDFNQRVDVFRSAYEKLTKDQETLSVTAGVVGSVTKNWSMLDRGLLSMEDFFLGSIASLDILGMEIVQELSDPDSEIYKTAENLKGGWMNYINYLETGQQELPYLGSIEKGDIENVGKYTLGAFMEGVPSLISVMGPQGIAAYLGKKAAMKAIAAPGKAAIAAFKAKAQKSMTNYVTMPLFGIVGGGGRAKSLTQIQTTANKRLAQIQAELKTASTQLQKDELNSEQSYINEVVDMPLYMKAGLTLLSGLIEPFSERAGSIRTMRNLSKFSKPQFYKQIKSQVGNAKVSKFIAGAAGVVKGGAIAGGIELAEEVLAESLNNGMDIYMGKDISIFEGIDRDFAVSVLINIYGMQSFSGAAGLSGLIKTGMYNTRQNKAHLRSANTYLALEAEIQGLQELEQTDEIVEQIKAKELLKLKSLSSVLRTQVEGSMNIAALDMSDFKKLIELESEQRYLYSQAAALGSGGSIDGRTEIESLKESFVELEKQRQAILSINDNNIQAKAEQISKAANKAETAALLPAYEYNKALAIATLGGNAVIVDSEKDIDSLDISEEQKTTLKTDLKSKTLGLFIGKKLFIFNENIEEAIGSGGVAASIAAGTPIHEMGHQQIRAYGFVKDGKTVGIADSLVGELLNKINEIKISGKFSSKDVELIEKRIESYKKINKDQHDADELIQLVSDLKVGGYIDSADMRQLWQVKGLINSLYGKIYGDNAPFFKLETANDVNSFIENWQSSPKILTIPKEDEEAAKKASLGTLLGDINALLPDEVTTRDQFFDRKVFNPIYNDGNLHPAISNYIRSRSVSKEEAQKIIDSVADRLINFNPEAKRKSGDAKITLGEFIFSNVNFGKLDARKALFEESQETARTQSTDTAEAKEIATVEESSVQTQDKPTYKTLLQRRVVDAEVVESIKNKVKSVVRVMKTRMDESVSKNVTVKPYIAELRKTMGKQADIDLKKAMGGKKDGQLRKFLLRNKAGILENMTTTWLMTSMPNAIQKKVNGAWTSDWKGKKIDRETVNADNAGRTSGAEMVRRLPNAATKLSDAEFLSNTLGTDGNPIRGKKESLAKAMAEEISFDIFNEALQDPNSNLAKAFENNQELKGVVLTDAYVTEVTRDVERGNVKRSISVKQVNEIRAHQSELIKQLEEVGNVTESRLRNALINVYIDNNKTSLTEAQLAEFAKDTHKHVSKYLEKQEVVGEDLFMGFVLNGIETAKVSDNILKSVGITLKEIFGSFKAMMDISNVQRERRAVELDFNSQFVKKNGKEGLIKVLKWMGGHNYTSTKIGQGRGQYYANKNDYYEKNIALIPGVTYDGKNVFYKGEIVKIPTKPGQSVNKVEVFEKEYDKRKAEAHEAWGLLTEFLGFVRATNNPVLWVATMKSLDSNMQSILKAAANVEYYFVGDSKIGLRYEHLIPTNYIMLQLSNHFWNKKIDLNKLEEAYVVAIIPTDMDENINLQFKSIMPLRWNPLKDPAWMRYYNSATFGMKDLKAIQKIGGKNKGTIYGAKWAEFSNKAYPDAVSNLNKLYKEEIMPASKATDVKRSIPLSDEFNNIIERKTGVESYKTYSKVQAKMRGANKGKFKFFIAPGADDFRGLVNYAFAGKGKQGETDMKFFEEKLLNPYFKGIAAIESARQAIRRDYNTVKKLFKPEHKMMKKKIGNSQFTYDQAVRVYLWEKQGTEVPGLSKRDLELLRKAIADNPSLTEYADAMLVVSKRMDWIDPSDYWTAQTILSDLNSMTEKIGRKKYLEEFIETSDAIFTEENMNKIEALYGTAHREALEDSLYAMKNGSNRPFGKNKQVNKWLNWINGSTGAIMFFNRRSALLQMLSFTNFTNWGDNNPLKQAAAFANQKQYWSDFAMIFNSDKLKERRSGLKTDVSESEIANAVADGKGSPTSALNYILKLGFTPTQIADSFAIATGGAMFYRNRVNSYLKEGMSKKQAEDKAFLDFSKRSDEAQQSSDPALVSMQQRSVLGRLVLAFANTPMQYTRLMKKAGQDLINGRGSFKENMSKIAYYGIVQNFIFSSLQSALFALAFDDEDDEGLTDAEIAKKEEYETSRVTRVLNGMMDTVLRGSGVYGAVVSVIKNTMLEYRKQEAKGFLGEDAAWILQILNLSPPIGSKVRKIYSAARTRRFEKDTIAERGWALTADGKLNLGPNYSVLGSLVSGIANVPLDRIVDELRSVTEALDERNKAWQRIALAFGWKTWDVGALNEEGDLIKAEAKVKRAKEKKVKAKATRSKSGTGSGNDVIKDVSDF